MITDMGEGQIGDPHDKPHQDDDDDDNEAIIGGRGSNTAEGWLPNDDKEGMDDGEAESDNDNNIQVSGEPVGEQHGPIEFKGGCRPERPQGPMGQWLLSSWTCMSKCPIFFQQMMMKMSKVTFLVALTRGTHKPLQKMQMWLVSLDPRWLCPLMVYINNPCR